MTDHVYFNIKAGSPAAEPITSWQKAVEAHKVWVRAFVKRHDLEDAEWIGMNGISVIGFAPKKPHKALLMREVNDLWSAWLEKHPLWRKVTSRRGADYAVPRKTTADAKVLAKEWASRPGIPDSERIGHEITGLGFLDFMQGMALHHVGWRIRKDDSILLAVPYFATKRENWKPLKGLTRGNQDKLRDEWHDKDDE